jgi:hypothetical protein
VAARTTSLIPWPSIIQKIQQSGLNKKSACHEEAIFSHQVNDFERQLSDLPNQ